ncbi:MAG: M48 family metallopeptidase [Acetobacter sp.]|nr:M48 family metallopeptidase [Acetobacter sp.]
MISIDFDISSLKKSVIITSVQNTLSFPETETLRLDQAVIPVRWRISSRARRVSLRPDPLHRGILITLPNLDSRTQGLSLLKKNLKWALKIVSSPMDIPQFSVGSTICINGENLEIQASPDKHGNVWISGNILHVNGQPEFHQRRITDYLRKMADLTLKTRIAEEATRTGLMPDRISIIDPVSRWGSCSSQKRIMLSWRLVLTPLFVRDYVILHELAHLEHLNHSANFWRLVDQLTPHRHAAEQWLKLRGSAIMKAGRRNVADFP